MSDESLEKAVTPELIHSIVELQSLSCLSSFALAGGTNLAFRFNHRRSIDIDLFSNHVIGKIGFEKNLMRSRELKPPPVRPVN